MARLLIAVVALSMAATPLLFLLYERVIAPRYTAVQAETRAPDPIDEHAPVILAGFGRFGNFVGRFMMAQGVKVTVLESDPDHVEMLRAFGFKVFYGDATRMELLHAAGIAQARMLIITLDDQAKKSRIISEVREKYPQVRILARAHGYDERFELMSLGLKAEDLVHEQMHSALELAVRALRALGRPAWSTAQAARRWVRYDDETMQLLEPVQDDFAAYAKIVRQRRIELTQLFEKDLAELPPDSEKGWDEAREAERG